MRIWGLGLLGGELGNTISSHLFSNIKENLELSGSFSRGWRAQEVAVTDAYFCYLVILKEAEVSLWHGLSWMTVKEPRVLILGFQISFSE